MNCQLLSYPEKTLQCVGLLLNRLYSIMFITECTLQYLQIVKMYDVASVPRTFMIADYSLGSLFIAGTVLNYDLLAMNYPLKLQFLSAWPRFIFTQVKYPQFKKVFGLSDLCLHLILFGVALQLKM